LLQQNYPVLNGAANVRMCSALLACILQECAYFQIPRRRQRIGRDDCSFWCVFH